MYNYILIFIQLYPYLYYITIILRTYEYIGYINRIYQILGRLFKKREIKKEKEIDEIYDIIMETEPGKIEITIDNDTNYVKTNEDKEITDEYF